MRIFSLNLQISGICEAPHRCALWALAIEYVEFATLCFASCLQTWWIASFMFSYNPGGKKFWFDGAGVKLMIAEYFLSASDQLVSWSNLLF